MPEGETGEKTEVPTAKRRGDARQEGNVMKSPEVSTFFVLLSAFIFLRFSFKSLYERLINGVDVAFDNLAPLVFRDITFTTFFEMFKWHLGNALWIIIPLALFVMFWGVFANIIQIGLLFTLKPIMPKLSKINPISGLKNLFSLKKIFDTAKNILKLVIIGGVAYVTIMGRLDEMLLSINENPHSIAVYMLLLIFDVAMRIILTLLIIAVLDYAYQKYEYEKKLKMTKQEVKDERKMSEGDPKIKARLRQLQFEMAKRRMMESVPKATVVVTNPTHISIAIRYEHESMDAPVVVAKGADHIALKIRETAKENDVPIYEDVALARAMFDKVEVGDIIPQEFFAAVAEIVAYVYRLQGKTI